MKILTWNINHRIGKKKIPIEMADALASLSPDIIVLTEYVQGPSHDRFLNDLKSNGFSYRRLSEFKEQQNRIFIASRMLLKDGDIKAPTDIIEAVRCNALHVTIPQIDLNILGLRMPLPMNAVQKKSWWDWVTDVAERNQGHPFIYLGDFNTDISTKGPNGWRQITKLKENGWNHALPKDGASWWMRRNGVIFANKLDHAFFSKKLSVRNAEYITESSGYIFVKKPGELKPKAMSDHAVLLVEFDVKP
ncbi:MAG: endonuclease/exonuclease/phosphatase family protein [Methanoregula sp.]|nr:endonuclease/exonuclease/phosphatase family protein [Methanoregula sp.]